MAVVDIDDIIEFEIINKLVLSVHIVSAVQVDDTFRIELCDVKYARITQEIYQHTTDVNGDPITYVWEINQGSFDANDSFIVSNADTSLVLNVGDILELKRPYYFRGTQRAVNSEWLQISHDEMQKLPMVWLAQPTDEEWQKGRSVIERISDITLFLVAHANFRDDWTKDLRIKNVVPLMNMAHMIADFIEDSPRFGNDFTYRTRDFSKFGKETPEGVEANIIDSSLSSVRLKISLPILKGNKCKC